MSEVVLAVVGGALALAGAVLCWRQRARGGHSSAIRVVTSRYLGSKRFLTIVEVDGERLLLGLAGDQVRLVTRLPAAPPDAGSWPAAAAADAPEAP